MPGSAYRRWTAERIAILCALVERGVSPARASVVLSCESAFWQHACAWRDLHHGAKRDKPVRGLLPCSPPSYRPPPSLKDLEN
jgi:hypothetical protein